MSKADDGSAPDPVRPVTFVAGNRASSSHGQFIDNAASRHSQFIDPVDPSGYNAGHTVPTDREARAGSDAVTLRAALFVFAASFVAVNIMLLRSLAASPDTWPPADPLAAAAQYGFSLITSTLVFGVVGTVLVLACWAAWSFVKERLVRRHT
jgi:hypothetical protein